MGRPESDFDLPKGHEPFALLRIVGESDGILHGLPGQNAFLALSFGRNIVNW